MKKLYLLIILLCSTLGFSQFNELAPWMQAENISKKENATMDEIVASFNEYWQHHDKSKKASGYKPFMRWETHWRNKTNEQGYLITPQEMWQAWAQKKNAKAVTNQNRSLPVSNWLPVGPFTHVNTGSWSSGQGRVGVVCVDPSNAATLYVGSPAGGIWKSTDSGLNWSPMSDNLPQIGVSGIAVDYSNPNTIYIATGDKDASDTYSIGVLKSTDGGVTWNTTGLTFTNTTTLAGDLIIHPTNNQILWCATTTGIWRTTDGGTNWTNEQAGNFAQGSIRIKPSDPTTVYAVSNNRFYKSTNTGDSFAAVLTGLPLSSGRLILDVTPANANYIYILSSTTGNAFQGIYRSTNSGTGFTKTSGTTDIFEGTQSWYDMALAASSTNADEVYTGCLNVWKSTNGGAAVTKINSWSSPTAASYTHADVHFLRFFNNNLYAGTDGGVYVSSNGGTNFSSLTAGLQISQFYKIAVSKQSADKMVGGLQDNGGHAYSSGAWKNYYGADGMDTAVDPNNSDKYYGFIQNGSTLYISSSGGNSISSSVASPSGETGNWVTPLATNAAGELFAGYGQLYKLNGGAWVQQNTSSLGTGNVELIAIDPSNDNTIYVVNGASLYKSTDKGIAFTNVYSAAANITSVCVHSSDSSIVYITTSGTGGQALKSTTGGTSFTSFSTGLPAIGKNVIRHQGRHSLNPLYLGTSLGVYYRDDSMSQWEPFDANLPNVSVTDLEINLEDAKITAATYGRGIWQSVIPAEIPQDDIKLESIRYPTIEISCGSVTPQISVKNKGLNAVTTVTINYQYNGTPLNYVWNGTISPSGSATINLPQITTARGVYTLDVTTTIVNDAYADNNHVAAIFYVNDAGTPAVVNTFTAPADNLLTYIEGSTTSQWQRGIRTGGVLATGTNNVYTTNFTGNYPDGIKSYLVSQCYNLTTVTNPTIRFKMAFDLEPNWDIVYVEYSTNFGQNWNVLGAQGTNWYNSNRTPLTTGADCNNCPGAQWTATNTTLQEYFYPLNALAGETNVIFRIVFHSDESANQLGVVVDDFIIDGTLANEQFELNNIAIYPNPSKGIFNIAMGTITPKTIEVFDLTGKIIFSRTDFQDNASDIKIDLSAVSSGIYFVKIASENQSVARRIIKN
ncbi:T9SS type A sorting domain-containing protein [Flavobacterium sp. GT3R68]|uniref:T9SS type A sorting domain-containing protein n=1 Tax=Flavobacterium sp. GT3R68 TaxID=2594437 RepID=UPI000F8747C1|nr:T9SS type A sorting domain-containing protein [Flavobacterium sp. GT3R68]RTY96005.1 T9SS type A sorting domain-containing protein [Flavobacterium sp. GSN2]TRW93778.1 T9SS type A sorting domain-containing protein [Flavobacterium sp. GT3R68]